MTVSTTARRLTAAALTAAAITAAIAVSASGADHGPHRERVKSGSVARLGQPLQVLLNQEWVEVTNTIHSVNLDGWTLADEVGRTCTFDHHCLAGRAIIRAGGGRPGRQVADPDVCGGRPYLFGQGGWSSSRASGTMCS